MKKIILSIAVVAMIATTTLFASARAFGDRTGIAAVVEEFNPKQTDDNGFLGRFKQKMAIRQILNRIADRLNLTDEQKAQIRQILQDARPRVQPILVSGLAVHQQIKTLGRDGVYNDAEVRRLATVQAQNAKLLIIEKEKVKAQIFAVLTPEQRAEAEKIRDEFEAKILARISEEAGTKF